MNGTTHPPMPAFYYAPATDTQELPSLLRGNVQPTTELHVLDLRPALAPARRPNLARRVLARVTGSRSLRASVAATFWPGALGAGLLLGVYLIAATRGIDLTNTAGVTYR